jgi:O-antigen/teichoic acid export membrane protein
LFGQRDDLRRDLERPADGGSDVQLSDDLANAPVSRAAAERGDRPGSWTDVVVEPDGDVARTVPQPTPADAWAGWLRAQWSDHMLRATMFNVASAVVTSLLGFLYWTIAARVTTTEAVGYTAAVMSLTTGVSLLTGLGVNSLIVERLPGLERTTAWATFVTTWLWLTAGVTAVVGAVVGFGVKARTRGLVSPVLVLVVVAVGATALVIVMIVDRVFLAARRTDLALVLDTTVSGAKVLSLGAVLLPGATVAVMLIGWLTALAVACAVACLLLLPRLGLGRIGRPARALLARRDLFAVFGHHLTSVGGLMTPYLLPPLVVYRLDASSNAYFYASWMLGSVFLIVSPAIAASLFAEGARDVATIGVRTRRAFRILAVLLPLPIAVGVLGGRWVLLVFGPDYAHRGYVLLAVLAIAAVPDAVTNVAVAVLRVTGRLRYAAMLNVAMGAVALVGAWVLLPRWGIIGAGVSWLTSQLLGCGFVAPMLLRSMRIAPQAVVGVD